MSVLAMVEGCNNLSMKQVTLRRLPSCVIYLFVIFELQTLVEGAAAHGCVLGNPAPCQDPVPVTVQFEPGALNRHRDTPLGPTFAIYNTKST
jgi:hypothetical protein